MNLDGSEYLMNISVEYHLENQFINSVSFGERELDFGCQFFSPMIVLYAWSSQERGWFPVFYGFLGTSLLLAAESTLK